MTTPEPESFSWLRILLAFAVVFGLLGLMGLGMRYINARGLKLPRSGNKPKRLELVETLPLDVRRRLVIVRCDGAEHLILLGINQDVVIQSNLDISPQV